MTEIKRFFIYTDFYYEREMSGSFGNIEIKPLYA